MNYWKALVNAALDLLAPEAMELEWNDCSRNWIKRERERERERKERE